MTDIRSFKRYLVPLLLSGIVAMILLTVWSLRSVWQDWYAEYRLRQRLEIPVTLHMTATPFADAQVVFRDIAGIDVELDKSLQDKIDPYTEVTIVVGRQPARKAIEMLVTQLGASSTIKGGTVYIIPHE